MSTHAQQGLEYEAAVRDRVLEEVGVLCLPVRFTPPKGMAPAVQTLLQTLRQGYRMRGRRRPVPVTGTDAALLSDLSKGLVEKYEDDLQALMPIEAQDMAALSSLERRALAEFAAWLLHTAVLAEVDGTRSAELDVLGGSRE